MKTMIGLAIAAALLSSEAKAERLANGLEFRKPTGWTVRSNDQAAALLPPDMAMEPGGTEPAELYIVGVAESITDVRNSQAVAAWLRTLIPASAGMTLVNSSQPFRADGGSGQIYKFERTGGGMTLGIHIYAVGAQNGAAGLIAMGRVELLAKRQLAISSIATSLNASAAIGSLQQSAPAPAQIRGASSQASGKAAQWDQKLRGRKLYQFSGYSSGYGSGGYNSQKTLLLTAAGTYEFRSSGSVSVYVPGASGGSSSQSGAQGRWRIYEQSGQVILELNSPKSGIESIVLTADGTKTLLNGRRWMVGD